MAITTDRAMSRLKALFPKANLSTIRITEYSGKLAPKIKDDATDEEVDAFIQDYNEVIDFASVAKNDDRIRTLEAGKPKEEVKKEEVKTDDPDEPAWFKKHREETEARIAKMEQAKTAETITSKFATDERVKNIPAIIRKGFMPTSDEDYEEKVEALVAEYRPYAEKLKLAGFTGEDTPGSSTGGEEAKKGKVKEISAEDAKKIIG